MLPAPILREGQMALGKACAAHTRVTLSWGSLQDSGHIISVSVLLAPVTVHQTGVQCISDEIRNIQMIWGKVSSLTRLTLKAFAVVIHGFFARLKS